MTVKEFIPQYLEFKTKTCKQTSVAAYALIIREHILPTTGNYQLEDITNKEAELLKSECERKQLSRIYLNLFIYKYKKYGVYYYYS